MTDRPDPFIERTMVMFVLVFVGEVANLCRGILRHTLRWMSHRQLRQTLWLSPFLACSFGFNVLAADSTAKAIATATFATKGLAATLATCSLPETCGAKAPIKASKQIRETGNDNLIDQRQLTFDGLQIEVAYVLGKNSLPPEKRRFLNPYRKPVIRSLTLTSPDWPVRHGPKVGSDRTVVEAALGRSGVGGADECVSYANEATQDEVFICYARGKVRSIKWVPWWDG